MTILENTRNVPESKQQNMQETKYKYEKKRKPEKKRILDDFEALNIGVFYFFFLSLSHDVVLLGIT